MNGPQVIRQILIDHDVTAEDFFGKGKMKAIVAARSEAAHRLNALKFSVRRIGQLLKLNHTTICAYLNPRIRDRKKVAYVSGGQLQWLEPGAREIVRKYAMAEGVPPRIIIAQWVRERAEHEAIAKASAA